MANTRISNLTASAANLAATDVTPVVQTTGVGPVKMTGLQFAGGLLGSTALTGATVTTSQPVLNLTQTWNAGAVTFTGLKFNATDTASASGSLLMDLQVGGTSQVRASKAGSVTASDITFWVNQSAGGSTTKALWSGPNNTLVLGRSGFGVAFATGNGFGFANSTQLMWGTDDSGGVGNLILTRATTATLQLGAADVDGSPVPQTLQVQSVTATTTSNNVAGSNLTINGSRGSGSGAGGSIIFQVAPAGSNGNSRNAYSAALTIASDLFLSVALNKGICALGNTGFNISLNQDGTIRLNDAGYGVRIASGLLYLGGTDLLIARDAANTLALKNSTNPQIFRAYSTTTGPSYGYFASGVTDAGVATADTLFIGTGGAGAAMTKLALVVNGTSALSFTTNSTFRDAVFNNNVTCGGFVFPAHVRLSNARIYGGPVDGSITFYDANETGAWNRINFGANGASNPALKRSTTTLQVRLADDSAFAPIQGKLTTDTARTAGDPTTDGYLVIYDSTGTAYKVPCVAV